jgi:Pyruvate dehydrogenase complex, dehydrogenase (E1) component
MQDLDPVETQEWLDALESVLDREGEDRAHYLMTRMGELATRSGTPLPYGITTPYRNTIPVTREAKMPGDLFMERRIRSLVRWNALAMVMRANLKDPDLGGHISTFRLQRHALRHRLQLLLPGTDRRAWRRPDLLPGPRLPRHLRPRLPGRPPD